MLKVPFSRIPTLSTRLVYSIRTITAKELTELDPIGMDDAVLQEENIAKRQQDLDKKRNKSGLSTSHFNLMHGRPPYSEPWHRSHYTTVYQRKRYAKFGAASNVDPRICWMDKEELASKLEYDSLAENHTIPEMIKMAKEKRLQEEKKISDRDVQIQSKLLKLAAWETDLVKRQKMALAAANAVKAKKEKLIEEVRRHFGFKVDPKDERFQSMLDEKEKQQQKVEKLAKKAAKEAKMIAAIQQKSAEIAS